MAAADVVGVFTGTIDPTEVALDVFIRPGLAGGAKVIGKEHFVGLSQGGKELLNGFANGSRGFEIEKHLAEFPIESGVAGWIEWGKCGGQMLAGRFAWFVEADEDETISTEKVELLLQGEFAEVE